MEEKRNYKRRMKMFDVLVESIMLYGVEVWGWKNEERIDRLKRKCKVDFRITKRNTELYTRVEETKMKELTIEQTFRYEEGTSGSNKKIVSK